MRPGGLGHYHYYHCCSTGCVPRRPRWSGLGEGGGIHANIASPYLFLCKEMQRCHGGGGGDKRENTYHSTGVSWPEQIEGLLTLSMLK